MNTNINIRGTHGVEIFTRMSIIFNSFDFIECPYFQMWGHIENDCWYNQPATADTEYMAAQAALVAP